MAVTEKPRDGGITGAEGEDSGWEVMTILIWRHI